MQLNDGAMQDYALTLDRMIEHAAKWHPDKDVVTRRFDGSITRTGYAAMYERSRKVSAVLQWFGLQQGDRVCTLAWNSQAHMECWYGIMGLGAVCHTLNPRLTAEQLAWMIGQSEVRIMIVSEDLLPLASKIAGLAPLLNEVLVIDKMGPDAPQNGGLPNVQALEPLVADADASEMKM